MAHVTLYRRFRPTTWDRVIGQGHIVTTLINQIKNDSVGHAYLFTGTRGTGKTSSAKIFARAVNCLSPVNGSPCGKCKVCLELQKPSNMDIIEMDAASNNGVDEIRELKESVQYPPTVGKYKVYIIDEVHMLTGAAFNALLKTLEEPPAHVIFILATTEVHKLPQTILSRCIRFDFRLVAKEELVALLERIFKEINYGYDVRALEQLALHGEGSVRDTLSLAEMCMSYAPDGLSLEQALEVLGASEFSTLEALATAILDGDVPTILSMTNTLYDRGKSVSTVNKELSSFFRDLIAVKNVTGYKASFTNEEYKAAFALADRHDNVRIGRAMDILAQTENTIRYSTQPRIIFDASLVKAAELYTDPSIEAFTSRIRHLEQKLAEISENGVTITATRTKTPSVSAEKQIELAKAIGAEAVEEAPVFETVPVPKEKSAEELETERIWGLLMTAVRESGNGYLSAALNCIENPKVTLVDNVMTLTVDDLATLEFLQLDENRATLSRLLSMQIGEGAKFAVTGQKGGSVTRRADKATLVSLFGNSLKQN